MRPNDTAFGGQPVPSCVLRECLTRVRDAQRAATPLPPRAGRRRGVGFAAMSHISGLMGTAATVQLRTDGSVALSTGCVDIGQGSDTVMVQICADALALPIGRVSYAPPGQRLVALQLEDRRQPLDLHDRTRGGGGDGRDAREDARARGRDAWNARANDLELRPGGVVGVKGVPAMTVTFKEIALRSLFKSGGPIAATHGFVFDGPRVRSEARLDPSARVRQSRCLHLRRALRGSRRRRGHRCGRGAPRVVRARRRARHQPGELRRARSRAASSRAWAMR